MAGKQALVLTDIVDSTRLNEELGDDAMAVLWARHDDGARRLAVAHRGREVGRTDGFLILFTSVDDAAAFALAYHALLRAIDRRMQARVGVHFGSVILRENSQLDVANGALAFEIDGVALPVAARLMGAAMPCQTLLSEAALKELSPQHPHRVADHGLWRMKGLVEPLRVYEVGDADAPFAAPPDSDKAQSVVERDGLWVSRRQVPHSLPAERDEFVGRGELLLELTRRMLRSHLVSVVGYGGTGKTRLVTRFGWSRLGQHAGGVWFCDLAEARTADGIVHAVGLGLGLALAGGDPVAAIARAIAGRGDCVVVLDNVEQVIDGIRLPLETWLDAAPQARFVVTSRNVLALRGESVLEVPPLSLHDSARLFNLRAESSGSLKRNDDPATIDELVRLLDGLPLAIELAAARSRVMSPSVLLTRVRRRFDVLTGSQGRPGRHATLKATFDWSWSLLTAAEKAALAQLTVFRGGFTLAAAEAVVEAAEGAPVVDLVQALVDKSLLRRVREERFGMLSALAEYAGERLAGGEGGGASAVAGAEARHARHFAELDEAEAVADRCAEVDNLVIACRRATAAEEAKVAVATLERAWTAICLVGPLGAGVRLALEVETLSRLDLADRATVKWIAASACNAIGQAARARNFLTAMLAEHADALDTRARARLEVVLGEALGHLGRPSEGEPHLERALGAARRIGDVLLQCRALNSLGALAHDRGDSDAARRHYEGALERARMAGDRRREGSLYGNLGTLAYARKSLDESRRLLASALDIAIESGDQRSEGHARCNLGLIEHDQGQLAEAREQCATALAIAHHLGHLRLEATALCNLGLVADKECKPAESVLLQQRAVDIAASLGDIRSEGEFRADLGRSLAHSGRLLEARECFSRSLELLDSIADTAMAGTLLIRWASVETEAGDAVAAGRLLERVRGLIADSDVATASLLSAEIDAALAISSPSSRATHSDAHTLPRAT